MRGRHPETPRGPDCSVSTARPFNDRPHRVRATVYRRPDVGRYDYLHLINAIDGTLFQIANKLAYPRFRCFDKR
jgi:hypothetical protein